MKLNSTRHDTLHLALCSCRYNAPSRTMDDPWAAPSASASTSKVLAAMTMPTSPPRPPRMSFSPPPEQLDVADPWGAPAKVPVSPKWEPRKSWEARPSWDGERERESTSSPVIDEGWGTPEPGLEQHDTVSSARPSFERRSLELKASESLRVSLDEPAEAQAADTALELSSMGHASSPARVASPPLDTSFARLSHEEPSHEEPSHEEPSQSFADISLSSVQASSMRRSPSFGGGSDFGDFGTGAGDPWGAGGTSWKDATEGGWGQEVELQREGEEDTQKGWGAERDSEPSTARGWDQEASWGGARAASPPPQASKQEEDWEAEQRRVALSEQRAPFELITRLKKDWESVAADVAGDSVLETSEEAEAALASGAAELEDNVYVKWLATLTPVEKRFVASPTRQIQPLRTQPLSLERSTRLRFPAQHRTQRVCCVSPFGRHGMKDWSLGQARLAGVRDRTSASLRRPWLLPPRLRMGKPVAAGHSGVVEPLPGHWLPVVVVCSR